MFFRESQSKWFAKRGLSWHIGVVTFKDGENENDDFQTKTFVHVFDSTTQDAAISTAILSNTLENINILKPEVSKVYIRSDNAGCFHSSYGICSVPVINKKIKNLKVNRIDFSDPQGGKSICDRRAAHIKSHIRRYVNEGNNVVTATDFKQAIEETMPYVKVIIAAPPIGTSKVHTAKLEKITSLNNFQFHNNGITVWKQYRIGPGKFYSHRQLQIDFSKPLVNLTVISESKCVMKTKKERCQEMTAEKDTTPEDCVLQEPDVDLDTEPDSELSSNVFTCPEDGCISSFLKYGNLLNHLSCGKHTFHSGNLVMKDRVAMKYSSLMETKSVNAHVLRACPSASALDTLGKGWGFKEKKESKPFTPEQAQYLIQKFNVGERSGIKCDPEDVSREMRSIKDGDGKRIFTSKHFLSAIQVSSYFSRLSLKKRQSSNSSYSEIDLVAEEKASNIASLSSELK